ncbi:coiled-coil alpha-helical rod protein 1 [Anolis carolinensis]|uniref:Coiled-coil alpha-helical rod protein 1 n=1 Tax=Anolis carolinensis TaxID=28377 RepID=H9GP50_ANOCA|nr:PREDICTED: coiled-coil alpha-helical rod protein 1 [Anolis carolinensis]XP_008120163.1 PREDICTED: coiled-coil alpha-helical rod protein 1 [Anolis carolinensis]XP_008120164.1 PREDICTED: coiled-coil alpha-helical rod protein 1 [Anolis carolinensis]|eukprot:XP_003228385.2 PREDICTED: coiled-coil alpha-helical rod protein 1 [Anolis carolinensis]
MDRKKDSDKQLEPPAAFGVPRSTEPRGLIPPSHFQSRSAPPLPGPVGLPWGATSLSNWEAAELKQENQRLKDELQRWRKKGEKLEEAGNRKRSLDREAEPLSACHTMAMSQQAEIISHQLHEIQRLEAELASLRVASVQQEAVAVARENTLVNLQGELAELKSQSQAEATALKTELEEVKKGSRLETEALREELEELRRRSRLEADSLRQELELAKERHALELGLAQGELQGALEKAEAERKRYEERAQEGLQTLHKEHQTELLRLSEVYGAEVASLKNQVCVLQQDLETHHKETVQLREKKDDLQNQLSMAKAELASQNALMLQLKTYVGEQESRQPTSELEHLRNRVQQLEDEKEALKITAELLQVRLASLTDILTLQETELSKKVQLQDPLQSDSSQKLQGLLTCWREKVFSLLVQLKSQELSHRNAIKQLDWKVKDLEEEVESREQKVALLSHSLEDKTAEANMEQVRNKTLQAEALRSKELAQKLQIRAEAAENALKGLGDLASRVNQHLLGQEETWKATLSRLAGLGNRVAFAAKRVDTIQGLVCQKIALAKLQQEDKVSIMKLTEKIQPSYEDLQAELQMLHEERDQLSMELKRGAQLIERKVAEAREKVESDLQDLREKSQSLQEALEAKAMMEQALRQQQEDTERQLEKVCQDLQKSEESEEGLRHELGQMRAEYEKALQEKVTEVEMQLRKDLSEMEKCLNEARREHTQAVVALRQTERQAARDKARSEELAKLQESATQQEVARLEKRMQELERDKNLLMVTLKEEGLLAQHKQNRRLAIRGPEESTGKTGHKPPSKESLFAVLDDLQALGAAILNEEEADRDSNTSAET